MTIHAFYLKKNFQTVRLHFLHLLCSSKLCTVCTQVKSNFRVGFCHRTLEDRITEKGHLVHRPVYSNKASFDTWAGKKPPPRRSRPISVRTSVASWTLARVAMEQLILSSHEEQTLVESTPTGTGTTRQL